MDKTVLEQNIRTLKHTIETLEKERNQVSHALQECRDQLAALISPFQIGDIIESGWEVRNYKGKYRVHKLNLGLYENDVHVIGNKLKKDGALSRIFTDLWRPEQYTKVGHMDLPAEEKDNG